MRRAVAAMVAAMVAGGSIASCGVQTREVELTFYDDGTGPHGFTCKDEQGTYLAARVVKDKRLSFVVDFFRLDSTPACSAVALLEWCGQHACPLLLEERSCMDIPLDFLQGAAGGTPSEIFGALEEKIRGRLVTDSPPEGIVLVRVVATTASCADVEAYASANESRFDCSKLVGCTNSCPVVLQDAGGDVQLDLDVRPEQCNETAIGICASPDLAAAGTCGP